jgi:hypothetical protein
VQGTVQSMEPQRKKAVKKGGKKSRAGGFAKKLEEAMSDEPEAGVLALVPKNTEVFIVVAPTEKELQVCNV